MIIRNILKKIFYSLPYVSKKDEFYIERIRHKKFLKLEKEFKNFQSNIIDSNALKPTKVFVFWYQGYEAAPNIIKRCIESIKKYTKDYEFVFLERTNLKKICSNIPPNIWVKFEKGFISITHLSDIVRFYLLATYGGVWIDASCMLADTIPEDIVKSDVFFFKSRANLDGDTVVSSWFISSKSSNPVVKDVYDMLVLYWSRNNKMIDYFLVHYLITISFKRNVDFWYDMPFYHNLLPHYIQYCLLNKEKDNKFQMYLNKSFVHKLTYKISSCEKRTLYMDLSE